MTRRRTAAARGTAAPLRTASEAGTRSCGCRGRPSVSSAAIVDRGADRLDGSKARPAGYGPRPPCVQSRSRRLDRERQIVEIGKARRLHGRNGGPAEQVALAEVDFAFLERQQVATILDALRDHCAPMRRLNETKASTSAFLASAS